MRSRSMLALLALAAFAVPARAQQDTRPGVAVLAFENGGSYGLNKEDYDALQRGMAGMMISELAANPAWRVVERAQIQKLLDEQNLGTSGRIDAQTAAKIGKLVGAKYVVTGSFIDLSGDFRLDVRVINGETSEIVKTESDHMQREHLFDLIRGVAQKLMKDVNLPALAKNVSDQRMSRQVPTEALTYYSRALLYQDRGQSDKAKEMYQRAVAVFPDYTEAKEGLQRLGNS
ncbi:MAG TPA: CsgG/HfaB family protein [Gemmatimonadales bacterium]